MASDNLQSLSRDITALDLVKRAIRLYGVPEDYEDTAIAFINGLRTAYKINSRFQPSELTHSTASSKQA